MNSSEVAEKQEECGKMSENFSLILKLPVITEACSQSCNEVVDSVNELSEKWILDIDLRGKNLASLPKFLPNYQFVTSLNLSRNNLADEIDWLIHLKRLKKLDLSHNKIKKIADVCGSALSLESIDVSFNLLEDLPEWVLFSEKVRTLNLGFNPLNKSNNDYLKKAKWKSIEICHLENLNLSSLPPCLHLAKNLRELYLGRAHSKSQMPVMYMDNTIWQFPDNLPSSLTLLDVSHVKLYNFECEWRNLVNLQVLKATGSVINWLSDDFVILKNLEVCDMSECKIFLLPKKFGYLSQLHFVNLSFNKLTVIPKSFELLYSLKHLDLYSSGVETFECDLNCLPSLIDCDLWMNFIEPVEILSNHPDLCNALREGLTPKEREYRLCSVCPSIISDESGESRESSFTDNYDQNDQENLEEIEPIISHPAVSPPNEESWDEIFFSDQDSNENSSLDQTSGIASMNLSDNDHYFLPSILHASSCFVPPIQFQTTQGQFDDAE